MPGFEDIAKYALPGIGSLFGFFGNKPKETSQSYSNTTSGSTSRTVTPEQQSLISPYTSLMIQRLIDPEAGLGPVKDQLRSSANSNFSNLPGLIKSKYKTSGGTNSGKAGRAARLGETARLGALSQSDMDYWQKVLDTQNSGAAGALGLIGMPFGQSYSQSGSGESKSTGPDNSLQGLFEGGLQGLLASQKLKGIFGGGG